jgi:hypothetical protein
MSALRAVLCHVHPVSREEMRAILAFLRERGMTLAGIARTFGGAEDMKSAGEADLIVTDSRRQLPMDLLVISQEIRVQMNLPPQHRRPRRLRRGHRTSGE